MLQACAQHLVHILVSEHEITEHSVRGLLHAAGQALTWVMHVCRRGEDGYIRISRRVNDCGIATQPMYVDLELQ